MRDPTLLGVIAPPREAMEGASFVLTGESGIWEARFMRPDQHGKTAARKSPGLAGAVVDNGPVGLRRFQRRSVRRRPAGCVVVRLTSCLTRSANASGFETHSAVIEDCGDLDFATELGHDRAQHLQGQPDLAVLDLRDR